MPFDERSLHAQAPLLATLSSSFLQMVLSLVSRIAAVVIVNDVVLGFGFEGYQFNFDHGATSVIPTSIIRPSIWTTDELV